MADGGLVRADVGRRHALVDLDADRCDRGIEQVGVGVGEDASLQPRVRARSAREGPRGTRATRASDLRNASASPTGTQRPELTATSADGRGHDLAVWDDRVLPAATARGACTTPSTVPSIDLGPEPPAGCREHRRANPPECRNSRRSPSALPSRRSSGTPARVRGPRAWGAGFPGDGGPPPRSRSRDDCRETASPTDRSSCARGSRRSTSAKNASTSSRPSVSTSRSRRRAHRACRGSR